MEKVLSGKPIASLVKARIKELVAQYGLKPKMVLIQLGSDPAAAYYVQNIISNGARLGCEVSLLSLGSETSQEQLLEQIERANLETGVHGIMIQKPLPGQIDDAAIGSAISPAKDVDCLNPLNLGRIILEEDGLLPCTPLAVLYTLIHYQIPVEGARAVVIGRSSIVGKPLANMLLWKKSYANASVTVCHSRSRELREMVSTADIVVAAVGKAEFITGDMVKKNSVLIDVGINPVNGPDGKPTYVGDIDYNSCLDKALAITPVPGGIGSVTTSLLFQNLVKASLASIGVNKSVDDFLDLIFNDYQNNNLDR